MARSARKISESGMYHVLLRSSDGIFDTETDYIKFIAIMKDCFLKYGGLLGYTLLPNRVHIVILDKAGKLSAVIRTIASKYSRYKGESVFYDRFKCEALENSTELSQLLDFISSEPLLSESELVFCSERANDNASCPLDIGELDRRRMYSDGFRMFMDDYKNMPENEIKKLVGFVAEVNADEIKNFADRNICIQKLVKNCPISSRRLAGLLGISRNCFTGAAASPEAGKNTGGRELDVWLL